MRYNAQQLDSVAKELQKKFLAGDVKNYEIVVTLVAMCEAGRIAPVDIRDILFKVFMGNIKGITRALDIAKEVIDKQMIEAIVKEVKRT